MDTIRLNGDTVSSLKDNATDAVKDLVEAAQEEGAALVYLRAAGLGFVAGLRSMTPLALLSQTKEQDPEPTNRVEEFLDSQVGKVVVSTLASGELIGDKLPFIPSRLKPGPLFGRLVTGAVAGMGIARRYRQPLVVGALLGAAGAGAGSFAGSYFRTSVAKATKLPDWALGIVEDGVAVGVGYVVVKVGR